MRACQNGLTVRRIAKESLILAAEAFDNKWISIAAFLLANSLVYSTLLFLALFLDSKPSTLKRIIARNSGASLWSLYEIILQNYLMCID